MNIIQKSYQLPDGREVTIETGKLAKQADGSVVVRVGNLVLLATVVSAKEAVNETADFMPLSVDYKEKFASIGRFPGGFMKREARPSDYEVLIARLVDRALRPLFPNDYHAETFVTINLFSADKEVMPDAFAGLAASTALMISNVPFNGPISEVRVARINGEFKINPVISEMVNADIDIIVAATMSNIVMVEGEMNEVAEADMLEAIKFAHGAIKIQCQIQLELAEALGIKKREYCHEVNDEELKKSLQESTYQKVYDAAKLANPNKHERSEAFENIKKEFLESLADKDETKEMLVNRYFHDIHKDAVRRLILDEGIRLDGRKTDQIRPIWCEVDYLPSAHGSAIFTRGETQSITTVTLGTKLDEKIIDEVMLQGTDKFLLHYNFPPFSTGDAKPSRGLSRREIGHGNLAHRALKRMIPPNGEINPYTIRIVSDILESNGSSSMATVCASTLALMDTGVKIKRPVSGIAMGLITDNNGKFAILSDILGDEDHLGDMDFKVTGTSEGITATQMDIKTDGLSFEIMAKALEQARQGRLFILDKLTDTLAEPRADYKPNVPRIEKIIIPKEMIGAVIGQGGKVIQQLQADTGTTIVIEEIDNKGVVDVFAENLESIEAAIKRIKEIIEVPEIGKVYKGKVKGLKEFGAFIEFLPGKEGLLHISEYDYRRIKAIEDVLKDGDELEVKIIDIDKAGKVKLSRKALLPRPEGMPEGEERPHRPHGEHSSGRPQGQYRDRDRDQRRSGPGDRDRRRN
ncbi:MAG: polyribonucleotide nucleotidyltransferase [Bacteroidia bacterium]|nr:polyribonucleotide nucleotidyltransferase [Bacteroidia bacterium]